jgi:hypothetical protein
LREIAVIRGLAATLGLAIVFAPAMACAQVNIDQDKSPAQMYAGDCAACHKSVRGLANGRSAGALASFLSEHYTASAKEAAAVAAYVLASGGAVGRAAPARGQPDADGAGAAAEPPKSREAHRPERPDEKPGANAKPDVAGTGRKPEVERRAAAEPGRPGSARGALPERRGTAATRTRGRVKPGEEARPVEEAKPAEETKPVEEAKPAEEAKPVESATPVPASPAPEAKTAVVAAPPPAETPKPQVHPVESSEPAAAAAPGQPAETAPAPRDNIPD